MSPEVFAYLFPGWERPEPVMSLSEAIVPSEDDELCCGSRFESAIVPLDANMPMKARKARPPRFGAEPPACKAPAPEEEPLDPRTEEILAEIRRLQDKYDVSIDELEILLGYTVRLSPLHITKGGRIFLANFDNREVKMPNISKALYFLYLRHPEGLRYKEIIDHKDELLHIYGSISGRDNPEEIEKSIDLLADPYGNALNVNSSRIKTAFRNAVSDRVARFYYINGSAGGITKVPLDRDLVR
ncbi:MAG: hypothetical protein J6X25_07960, partial [Bacteroidales bacterium]|nr:hypothetical protein [Bacteroidales bacterium]